MAKFNQKEFEKSGEPVKPGKKCPECGERRDGRVSPHTPECRYYWIWEA